MRTEPWARARGQAGWGTFRTATVMERSAEYRPSPGSASVYWVCKGVSDQNSKSADALGPVRNKRALVIGGGIAGIQAALDLANARIRVTLVEKSPSLGGRMAQLDKTFPTMDCSI